MRSKRLYAMGMILLLVVFVVVNRGEAALQVYHSKTKPKETEAPPAKPPWNKAGAAGAVKVHLKKWGTFFIGVGNTKDLEHPKMLELTITGNGAHKLSVQGSHGYYSDGGKTKTTIGWVKHRETLDNPEGRKWTLLYDCQPEWEWIRVKNTGKAQNFDLTIKVNCTCIKGEVAAANLEINDGVFGSVGDMIEGWGMRIIELQMFPMSAMVDTLGIPTISGPDTSGNWTSEFVYVDPEGQPREQGGVMWSTDGPGLAAGDPYSLSFSMIDNADSAYSYYALDDYDDEYQYYLLDLSTEPTITGISHTPTIPGSWDHVTVMASIPEPETVIDDTLFYQVNGTTGSWTSSTRDSTNENYYYYTISNQSSGDTVYFYIWTQDEDDSTETTPVHKYLVLDSPPGIMINEFVYDTPGEPDSGCFIELYGTPSISLDGYGLVGVDGEDGADYAVIDLSGNTIPPDGYFVVAQDSSVANFDVIDALADLENGPDNLQLRKDGFIYDAIGYDDFLPRETFVGEKRPTFEVDSTFAGFSLGRDLDGWDTDDNRIDFGAYGPGQVTPGGTNPSATGYTIREIQETGDPGGDSPHNGERVMVDGIVTAGPDECSGGYFIEMYSGGGWSGVLIWDDDNEPNRGDDVEVTGTVQEYYGRTEIGYITGYTNYGSSAIPQPLSVSTATVAVAESLEGVLVQVQDVVVVDTLVAKASPKTSDSDYWWIDWLVTDGAVADTCRVGDAGGYTYDPDPGDTLGFVCGVVDYYGGHYKVEPRDDDDLGLGCPPQAPDNLTATLSVHDIYLQWSAVTLDSCGEKTLVESYVVYKDTRAYVCPSSDFYPLSSSQTFYLDTNAVGDTETNYYYWVRAVDDMGQKSEYSHAVGEFDKGLGNMK